MFKARIYTINYREIHHERHFGDIDDYRRVIKLLVDHVPDVRKMIPLPKGAEKVRGRS